MAEQIGTSSETSLNGKELSHLVDGKEDIKCEQESDKFDTEKLNTNSHVDTDDKKTKESASSSNTNYKTEEVDTNDTKTGADSKIPKELKSILQLAKEANLDTNISHKRVSVEPVKPNEKLENEHKLIDKGSPRSSSCDRKSLKSSLESKRGEGGHSSSDSEISKFSNLRKVKKRDDVDGASKDLMEKDTAAANKELISTKMGKDMFCWRCHRDGTLISCETCPRSYHQKCVKQTVTNRERWPCPECVAILKAESTKTRSPALKGMTLEHLCELLKFAVKRMSQCAGAEPFLHPVSDKDFPNYRKYIVQPMDLTCLERNIKNNLYGSTQAFEADAKWILHNSIIFNSYQSKFTTAAKAIIKICKQEMQEIEKCPSCYLNANTKKNSWFIEVCPKPHILVWAKLKGFPYWPAKAMQVDSAGMVDVRFFGAHDRAWVPYKDCYLYSKKDPNSNNMKKNDINECIKELEVHIEKLQKTYGKFRYAPYRTVFEPDKELEQLQKMLPLYKSDLQPVSSSRVDKNASVESPCLSEASVDSPEKSGNKSVQEDDKNMEGYGTDDEVEDNIDKERRKALLKRDSGNGSDDEACEKGCDEADDEASDGYVTQVDPSLDESRGHMAKVRMRGGLTNNTSGKVKILPRQLSENRKRQSNDELLDTPYKFSRRNSDQSVKSDSSRLSNISDRISKVDISENMEISVNNDDTGNISISENVSDMSESSRSDVWLSEMKRKPIVQVNVENTEFSISPQNKSKIADQLIRKLGDTDENKVDGAKKNIAKTHTDMLLEKMGSNTPNCDAVTASNSHFVIEKVESLAGTEKAKTKGSVSKESSEISSTSKESVHVDQSKSVNNNSVQIADDYEDDENPDLEDTQIDEANIRNIIHSSLNEGCVADVRQVTDKSSEENLETNKRKSSTENAEGQILRNKLQKLIDDSNQMIQNSTSSGKENAEAAKPKQTDSKLTRADESVAKCVPLVEIKSEPCSEDEGNEEAQRELFSALNISKKTPETPKAVPEIRTRSKVEELMKFKVVDNLTKVIDSVASQCTNDDSQEDVQNSKKKEICVKPLAKMQSSPVIKQKARKSFPVPAKRSCEGAKKDTASVNVTKVSPPQPTTSFMIVAQSQPMMLSSQVLPPNQQITYNSNLQNPILNVIQQPLTPFSNIVIPQITDVNGTFQKPQVWENESQNYIPQSGQASASILTTPPLSVPNTVSPPVPPLTSISTSSSTESGPTTSLAEEFSVLKDVLPESVTRAVSEMLSRPLPKLKPRPPSALAAGFDEGIPSSAGPVASKINSVSHRLADYFRGMLIETLNDLGTSSENPEVTIANLQHEVESLKHKHQLEIAEMKKNICSILKDIQRSILEEKERVIEETRSKCEAEAIKRVEEAKSKQWCASCSKEAQFYCCWNTSYCDYPCQQKHWPKHMSKCTQNSTNSNVNTGSNPKNPTQQIVLRPAAPPKSYSGKTLIAKPTKVIVNRGSNMKGQISQIIKTSTSGHITLVESTPGNYELVGNGPISIGGKLIATSSILTKIKSGNVITVSSPSGCSVVSATSTNSPKTVAHVKSPSVQMTDSD